MDKEVLREIWHGQLPLCFKLHPDDVSGMHRPEPYYMMVPRVTYFPLVLDRVVKYFNRFMDQNKQAITDMWLDYEGQPIKWQLPVGLSWDLFGSNYDLPWRLMLHFSDFPAKELIRCNSKASIETDFISCLKEADALKHKRTVMKNMVKKDHNQLWSSLLNDKFDQFWSINQRLMEREDNGLFKSIPFRLHLPDYTYIQKIVKPCTVERHKFLNTLKPTPQDEKQETKSQPQSPLVFDTQEPVMNKLHSCCHLQPSEDGESLEVAPGHRCSTLLDLIDVCFANRMQDLLLQADDDEKDDKNEQERGADQLIDVRQFKFRFISHGIEVPFDTPLQWLSEHISYPDNFLHICAVAKSGV